MALKGSKFENGYQGHKNFHGDWGLTDEEKQELLSQVDERIDLLKEQTPLSQKDNAEFSRLNQKRRLLMIDLGIDKSRYIQKKENKNAST